MEMGCGDGTVVCGEDGLRCVRNGCDECEISLHEDRRWTVQQPLLWEELVFQIGFENVGHMLRSTEMQWLPKYGGTVTYYQYLSIRYPSPNH